MKTNCIGVILDENTKWWKKFGEILEEKKIPYTFIDIAKDNWLKQIEDIEYIIWRPNLSEPYLRQAREKLYILENLLSKKVYPNGQTFWHYNNKNAESYFATVKSVLMPDSFVSYSYEDSLEFLKSCDYPIVSKAAGGAGSKNVRLLRNLKEAKNELDHMFNKGFVNRVKNKILRELGLRKTKYDMQRYYVNYQEFIPDNLRDFRVSTVGDRFAFAFYRKNRKNDFRASGSSLIEYDPSEHDMDAIKYCLGVSKANNFDTMCFDILYKKDGFVCTEFSYIFDDAAIYDCPGYYLLEKDELRFVDRHTWPQELIVEYLLEKWMLREVKS